MVAYVLLMTVAPLSALASDPGAPTLQIFVATEEEGDKTGDSVTVAFGKLIGIYAECDCSEDLNISWDEGGVNHQCFDSKVAIAAPGAVNTYTVTCTATWKEGEGPSISPKQLQLVVTNCYLDSVTLQCSHRESASDCSPYSTVGQDTVTATADAGTNGEFCQSHPEWTQGEDSESGEEEFQFAVSYSGNSDYYFDLTPTVYTLECEACTGGKDTRFVCAYPSSVNSTGPIAFTNLGTTIKQNLTLIPKLAAKLSGSSPSANISLFEWFNETPSCGVDYVYMATVSIEKKAKPNTINLKSLGAPKEIAELSVSIPVDSGGGYRVTGTGGGQGLVIVLGENAHWNTGFSLVAATGIPIAGSIKVELNQKLDTTVEGYGSYNGSYLTIGGVVGALCKVWAGSEREFDCTDGGTKVATPSPEKVWP